MDAGTTALIIGVGIVLGPLIAGLLYKISSTGYALQGNDNVNGCDEACSNLVAKHMQTCSQRAAVAAAQSDCNAIAAQITRALAAAAVAEAAALAAALIPVLGPILAPTLATAAAAAWAYAMYLIGQSAGATIKLANANDGLTKAISLENDATVKVTSSCSQDKAQTCINSLPPCP